MSRPLLLAAALVALVQPGSAQATPKKPASATWAAAEIRLVVSRGLMGGDLDRFRPEDPVTRGELAELLTAVTQQEQPPIAQPNVALNMEQLNARLVIGLGLRDSATTVSYTHLTLPTKRIV